MMPLFLLGLLMSLIFCGLALDVGQLEMEKTRMQTAADAAAIAEEMHFERQTDIDNSDGSDGFAAATSYGYTNGVNNTTVTYLNGLYTPVSSGDYAGHYDIAQITITRQVSTIFMGLINQSTVNVMAVGIASPPPCLYFLGTKGIAPWTVELENTAATAQFYSKCSTYIGNNLYVPAGAWWQAFQNYIAGPSGASTLAGRVKSGTTFNSLVRPDPLATIAQPTAGSCASTNYSHGTWSSTTSVTLNPGTYCGSKNGNTITPGMTLLNDNVTLNPGLYMITGGVNWLYANVQGSGVTLFFTNVTGTTSYGTVYIGPGTKLNLSAIESVTLGSTSNPGNAVGGILFFADRNWVNTSAHDFSLSLNNSSAAANGIWYMPSTGLSMANGSGTCTTYCAIIADNLYVANWTFHQYGTDYTLMPGPNPLRATSVLVQ